MGGKVAKPAQELAGSENIEASAEGAGILASQERAVDSRVRIEGLTTQPELNGLEGTVKKLLKNDRLWVKLDTGQELNVGFAKTVLLNKIDNAPTARPGAQPFPANMQGQTKSQEEVEVEADEKRRIWEELARQRQEEKNRAGQVNPAEETPGSEIAPNKSPVSPVSPESQSRAKSGGRIHRTESPKSVASHWYSNSGIATSNESKSLLEETEESPTRAGLESRNESHELGSDSDDELASILRELDAAVAQQFSGKVGMDREGAIKAAFEEFDTDQSGILHRFCPALRRWSWPLGQHAALRAACGSTIARYNMQDYRVNSLMRLRRNAFASAMAAIGLKLSAKQIGMLFDEFDTTGAGEIAFEEFQEMLHESLQAAQEESSSLDTSVDESVSSTTVSHVSGFSMFSSDSQALQKRALILQVQAKQAKITGKEPPEGFFPYLILKYGDVQRSTSSIRRNTSAPSWNENFIFKVSDLTLDVIVSCHHWDGRNQGPGRLLGRAVIKPVSLLADFAQSDSSSGVGSSEGGSGTALNSSNAQQSSAQEGKYLGHKSSFSPSFSNPAGVKQSTSPLVGESPLPTLGSSSQGFASSQGRGRLKRAAMKQKGRIHKHGRFSFQESQKWYAFTDEEGLRVGGGSGIRIRLRPWAPKGLEKQLKIQQQMEEKQQVGAGNGIMPFFGFGRQTKTHEESDSDASGGSGSSLSTLPESEDEGSDYSSPDEIENNVAPYFSRNPAHLPQPRDMTRTYRNLFGDQTLEEQLKVFKQKQQIIRAEERNLKKRGPEIEAISNQDTAQVRLGKKKELSMMIGVVERRLRQAMRVNDMPIEKGWGWVPRSRRYTASGGICENEHEDGYGLDPLGKAEEVEVEDEEESEEEDETEDAQERIESPATGGEHAAVKSKETAHDVSMLSSAPSTPYVHADIRTPTSPKVADDLTPISSDSSSNHRVKIIVNDRDTIEGRAWLEVHESRTDVECMKAEFGIFRPLRALLRWAQPAQANAILTNGEDMKGCIAVVLRDPPNLHEHPGSQAEKVLKCVMAGAVGVIIINTGRGYELIAPQDDAAVTHDWPDECQVPVVCVRHTDVTAIVDGAECALVRRANSPSLLTQSPRSPRTTHTGEARYLTTGVRFQDASPVDHAPTSPKSKEGEGAGSSLEVQDERDGDSKGSAASPLKSPSFGAAAAKAKKGLLSLQRRLSLTVKYKIMPGLGMANMALDHGIQEVGALPEDAAISPLNPNNQRNPGVFKRAESNIFSRAPSIGSTADGTIFGRVPSLGRRSSITRTLSGMAAAVGMAAFKSSQVVRVAEDIVDVRDSLDPLSTGSPTELDSTDPIARFKRKRSLKDIVPLAKTGSFHDVAVDDIDPGEEKVLRTLADQAACSPRASRPQTFTSMRESSELLDVSSGSKLNLRAESHVMQSRMDRRLSMRQTMRDKSRKSLQSNEKDQILGVDEENHDGRRGEAVATVSRKSKDPHNKAIAVISTQAGWDEEGRVHLPAIISTQAGSNEEGRQGHLPGRTGSSVSAAKATWGKLRMAVKQEDEPAEGAQGEAVPEKTEETEDEKKIKKVMKLFKRSRSEHAIFAELKMEAGEELTTKEKLALFLQEKKLNKALRRVSSGAVQSSSKDTRVPPPGEAAAGGVLRRFGSFARIASLNLGALARTASFTIGDSKETFVRAGADSAGARLLTRESTLSKDLLPMLNAPVSDKELELSMEAGKAWDKTNTYHANRDTSPATEMADLGGMMTMKPKRPDSGRPSRATAAPGPASLIKK